VGFLAPALQLAAATRRRVSPQRRLVALYAAGAFGFGLAWAVLEVRRLFQGPSLYGGLDVVGRAEIAAYALLGLLVARLLFWVAAQSRRRAWTISGIADLVGHVGRSAARTSVIFAALAFGYWGSPWWGPIDRPLDSAWAAALLFGLYAAGAAGALWLVRTAESEDLPTLARGARACAVLIAFALVTLMVRLAFRGLDMRPDLQEASLETWAFSAVWSLYGFGLLVYGVARREVDLRWAGLAVLLGTTAKIFLFDMARLEGVVRAGSFLAVGALLLAAAVVARRFSGDVALLGIRREGGARGDAP
jgi:uncharacterized membrane protein